MGPNSCFATDEFLLHLRLARSLHPRPNAHPDRQLRRNSPVSKFALSITCLRCPAGTNCESHARRRSALPPLPSRGHSVCCPIRCVREFPQAQDPLQEVHVQRKLALQNGWPGIPEGVLQSCRLYPWSSSHKHLSYSSSRVILRKQPCRTSPGSESGQANSQFSVSTPPHEAGTFLPSPYLQMRAQERPPG